MNLIERFKNEHKKILEIFRHIKQVRINDPSSVKIILSAKNIFLNHLEKEDELLYPLLKQQNIKDADKIEIIDYYIAEMVNASKHVTEFFNQYDSVSVDKNQEVFLKDFDKIFSLLVNRIEREETELFILCNQIS